LLGVLSRFRVIEREHVDDARFRKHLPERPFVVGVIGTFGGRRLARRGRRRLGVRRFFVGLAADRSATPLVRRLGGRSSGGTLLPPQAARDMAIEVEITVKERKCIRMAGAA